MDRIREWIEILKDIINEIENFQGGLLWIY